MLFLSEKPMIIIIIIQRTEIDDQLSKLRVHVDTSKRLRRDCSDQHRPTGRQTGSEFTAHLRQDGAMPSALTSAPIHPPILPSISSSLSSLPSLSLPPPVNQPRRCLGPSKASSFPEGGIRQNRKCPDMSFRHGQFATRN